MRLAIFDIDGTLIEGSSERSFSRYLWRRRRLQVRQLLSFVAFMLRYLAVAGLDVAKKNKAYLAGLELAEVEHLAREFVAAELVTRLHGSTLARLRRHQQHGDIVLLLSGTLQMLAEALAAHLGVEHVCATLCGEHNGVLTAGPPERHPFAAAKQTLARDFAREHGLDLGQATAYCDSYHDLELLEQVAVPVVVEPDRRLRAIALARRWEVLTSDTGAESIEQTS